MSVSYFSIFQSPVNKVARPKLSRTFSAFFKLSASGGFPRSIASKGRFLCTTETVARHFSVDRAAGNNHNVRNRDSLPRSSYSHPERRRRKPQKWDYDQFLMSKCESAPLMMPKRHMHIAPSRTSSRYEGSHRAFIAFGSNMGDRLGLIEEAIRRLNAHEQIRVKRTSGIWETKAMYVVDQDDFLNGVCEIETNLEPLALLDSLQGIEISLDRVKTVNKGPRTIDLDILLYDDQTIDHERLIVPHKLMLERAFVLYPLSELIPLDEQLLAFSKGGMQQVTMRSSLHELPMSNDVDSAPSLIVPLSFSTGEKPFQKLSPLQRRRETQIMSIINLTPDSFSDGGLHPAGASDLEGLTQTIQAHLRFGASIIDLGGQSSRPGAAPISAEEEISRVVPVIRHLTNLVNSSRWPRDVPEPIISVDTYRAAVAHAAVVAGAHMVNDISGGTLDLDMLPTISSLFHQGKQCSVILMHMRGDPSNMSREPHILYPEEEGGVTGAVARELSLRVRAAEEAGIPRWRILLDPGIGFAKTGKQNCELLASLSALSPCHATTMPPPPPPPPPPPSPSRHQDRWGTGVDSLAGLPWVVGASRKKFIGTITEQVQPTSLINESAGNRDTAGNAYLREKRSSGREEKMAARIWGTSAAVSASIAGGADIVRVHDTAEMKLVALMADAIWRRR